MVEQQFYTILTKVGKAKIANSNVLNTKLNLTKFQVGDGGGAYYNPTEDQTKLKNKVWEGNINSIRVDKDNPSWIVIEVVIPSNEGGFMIREAGIMDDEGNLIAVGKYPETFKPHIDNGSSKDLFIRMILEVSNTQNVILKVDPTIIMATKKDIEVLESKLKSIENTVLELKNNPIVRGVIPSGFIKFNDIDFAYCSSNQNKIKLTNEGIALVNGWKVTIPDGTIIELGNPPTEGEREDLVFLECWLDQTTKELKYRIRVVDGVDFKSHREGLRISGETWDPLQVYAQAGLSSPSKSLANFSFCSASGHVGDMKGYGNFNIVDRGLYIAGQGTQYSKEQLKTFDGYAYAIPMFKIWRRNSTSYSDANTNGGRKFAIALITKDFRSTDTTVNISSTDGFTVGDWVYSADQYLTRLFKVVSIKSSTQLEVSDVVEWGSNNLNWGIRLFGIYNNNSISRPDGLFCDIIDKTDIIDLRHKTSLTGFDYQQMLLENFDRAGRGELQTNVYVDMQKVYHGISKTPIDANTLFYCSFDGTDIAEVGNDKISHTPGRIKYDVSPTGLAARDFTGVPSIDLPTPFNEKTGTMTIDLWYKVPNSISEEYIYNLMGTNHSTSLGLLGTGSKGTLFATLHNPSWNSGVAIFDVSPYLGQFIHIRTVYKNGFRLFYINGKLVANQNLNIVTVSSVSKLNIGSIGGYKPSSSNICDVAISNVDRGDIFATLPKDFIQGHAKIAPAFSEQRKCYSDALSTEYKSHILKSSAPGKYPKGITITQASGNWAANDTIKIKGLAGEIIMGVVDTDTAICRVVSYTDGQIDYRLTKGDIKQIIVSNIQGISVGDRLNFYSGPTDNTGFVTVNAIDTTNNILTLDQVFISGQVNIHYLFETTPSSSLPITKFKKSDGTIIQANMIWSGLGTNEAIGTIQTTTELTNQDLQIEYSIVEVDGQGPFTNIPYQILSAEINGQKYGVNGYHVIDDFAAKISGSIVENPHKMMRGRENANFTTLCLPNLSHPNFIEVEQSYYTAISSMDGSNAGSNDSNQGGIPQQMFSFNVVEIIEKKFGSIPNLDKVNWVRGRIYDIEFTHYGYGYLSPLSTMDSSGNKVLNWRGPEGWGENGTNKSKFQKKMSININNYEAARPKTCIDDNGFIHFMLYGDAATATVKSSIFTEYASITITLLKPSDEYDLLTPINLRKDAGVSNVIAVRKETNELRVIAGPTLDLNSKFTTYSNYVPYQGTSMLPKQGVYPLTDWVVIASTMGTGDYNPTAVSRAKFYKGIYGLPLYQKSDLYRFKCELMDVNGDKVPITKVNYHNTSLGQYAMTLNSPIGGNLLNDKYYRGYKLDNFVGFGDADNGVYGITADVSIKGNYYLVAARLVVDNQGNILMLLSRSNGNILYNDGAQGSADTFYLKDRPIIGGV